jgi:hypothetical protein
MENLPEIIISPITTEAVGAKVYDKMWVTDFVVKAENASQSSLYAILRPMCSTTGEVLVQAGTEQVVSLSDLFGILGGTKIEPKLTPETIALGGQVMGGVLLFLKKVLEDKAVPDPEIVEPELPVEPTQDDTESTQNNDNLPIEPEQPTE